MSRLSKPIWLALTLLLTTALLGVGALQRSTPTREGADALSDESFGVESPLVENPSPDRFTFVRIRYDSSGGYGESWYRYEGRDWERWETDFPRAENNLLFRLEQITALKVNPRPLALRLTDDAILDHPFIYLSDVGWMVLSRAEQRGLREYLTRGGFIWVDDFWGDAEWRNLEDNLRAACPGWSWRDLPNDHPILSSVYRLPSCPQTPARIFYASRGLSYDPPQVHRFPNGGAADLSQVHLRGFFDPEGMLRGVATHNTDVADGWEREGESKEYFEKFSVKSYALGVNILVYAMTR